MKKELTNLLEVVADISLDRKEKICKLLEDLLYEAIEFNSQLLGLKPLYPKKKVIINPTEEKYEVNLGVKRDNKTINFAEWIFEINTKSKFYLLHFLIIKESLFFFIDPNIREVDEAIVNIFTILWLNEILDLKVLAHPIIKAVNHRIYSDEIINLPINLFHVFQCILFVNNIPFKEAFTNYLEFIKDTTLPENEITEKFKKWVHSKTKAEDVISPIYLKDKYLTTLELMIETGSEKSNPNYIAKKLNIHKNTVTNHFRSIMTNNSAIWRAVLNYELLKLHSHFLKVLINDKKTFEEIYNIVTKIPYIRTLFTGKIDDKYIIYSPSLICPHIVSNALNERLAKYRGKGLVENYNLLMIHETKIHTAISTEPINPTLKFFKKSLNGDVQDGTFKKYSFTHGTKEFSMEFDDRDLRFDYNILYFLSILKDKYIIKQGYNVLPRQLAGLYEYNNISLSDTESQTYFLNQLEIRARRRKLLSYTLFMQKHSPISNDILIFELPVLENNSQKIIDKTIDRLRVFSLLAQLSTSNKYIFTIPGISHEHPIRKSIENVLAENSLESNFYTINFSKSQFVPLHELYDFDEQKWK
jgi:hypothetical protein